MIQAGNMNQPAEKVWEIQECQRRLEAAEELAESYRLELEDAQEALRSRFAALSVHQPYQLLREYYEKQLAEEKTKRRTEVERLKLQMDEQKQSFDQALAKLKLQVAELRSELAMYKDQVNGSGKRALL